MERNQAAGWPAWTVILGILAALLVGLVAGWAAHGLMMHRMMDGSGGMMGGMGMMGDRGRMGGMMDGSGEKTRRSRSGVMGRCREMMGKNGCPMMQASGDTQRQSPDQFESPVFDELDAETREWITTIRGDVTPQDARGRDTATVDVGAGEQGLSFDPAVLRVDPGTTVRYRWTGRGGVHDVAFKGSDRASARTYEAGHTWTITLDEPGVRRYVCSPHRLLGMKGLIMVGEGSVGDR